MDKPVESHTHNTNSEKRKETVYVPKAGQERHGLLGCLLHHHRAQGLEQKHDGGSRRDQLGEPGEGGGGDEVQELYGGWVSRWMW